MNRATKERWVYSVPGYSPSEPGFVKNPLTEDEDDGIVMAVMSPLADYDLRYLLLEVFVNFNYTLDRFLSCWTHEL